MTSRKNHHFVPQFYFRYFSQDNSSINGIIKSNGKIINEAPIKNQASKAWFYGESAEPEKILGEIENRCSQPLRKIIESKNFDTLNAEDQESILTWVLLQRSRTNSARLMNRDYLDKLAQLWFEASINKNNDFDEEVKQTALDLKEHIGVDPVQLQYILMHTALDNTQSISDLAPLLLLNKTNRPYIFSDNPVVFYNARYHQVKHRGVLGYESPGLMIFYPINSEICLLLLDAKCYTPRKIRDGNIVHLRELSQIREINRLQIYAASNCIYFGDGKFGDYAHSLWQNEPAHLTTVTGKFIEAPSYSAETGERRGDVLHGFEPQIPAKIKLDFLSFETVEEYDYQFSRRSERRMRQSSIP
ncbi:DUF4238 domain-containing protein [Pseudomonas sp. JBR1]|uniref:DUF4238 domain-containing protein n=1 Tax=Pseudomonas sp. JBR1 TaxID=3020907 RepID=UPI002305E17B|nr:DUF4238 domain-containing protein [Pseudomonas sp. JBR1]WCE09465.1 DUF4238 domain-containing protein [Pseudomonas sp. JBR1]